MISVEQLSNHYRRPRLARCLHGIGQGESSSRSSGATRHAFAVGVATLPVSIFSGSWTIIWAVALRARGRT